MQRRRDGKETNLNLFISPFVSPQSQDLLWWPTDPTTWNILANRYMPLQRHWNIISQHKPSWCQRRWPRPVQQIGFQTSARTSLSHKCSYKFYMKTDLADSLKVNILCCLNLHIRHPIIETYALKIGYRKVPKVSRNLAPFCYRHFRGSLLLDG